MFLNTRFSLKKARKAQILLSKKIVRQDCISYSVKSVGGVDVAYTDKYSIGGVAVFDYDSMRLLETKTSRHETRVPYIPTFLSYREIPPSISAISRLRKKPDIFLVDGHGVAHPRRLGFASHLGLVLDVPTIGVAKNILCGKVKDGEDARRKPIIHKDEIVGIAVSTKPYLKPVYVSVGHKVSLETAVEIVLGCTRKYRIPEPLREAHLASKKEKDRSHEMSL